MSIFDRIFSSLKKEVQNLSEEPQNVICFCVLCAGSIVRNIGDEFFPIIESSLGGRLSDPDRQQVSREIALAMVSSARMPENDMMLRYFGCGQDVIREIIIMLMLSEGGDARNTSEQLPYSQHSDENRVRLIININEILSRKFTGVVEKLHAGKFTKEFNDMASEAVDGTFTGFKRVDRNQVISRTLGLVNNLSPRGQAIVREYARRMAAPSSGRQSTDSKAIKIRAKDGQLPVKFLLETIARVSSRFLAEADSRKWKTAAGMPLLPGQTLSDSRQFAAYKAGFMMLSIAAHLENVASSKICPLDDLLSEIVNRLVTKEMKNIDEEARRLGFKGSADNQPNTSMVEAYFNLMRLYAKNAVTCATAMQTEVQFPLHKLYETLGPDFGGQSDESTLAQRYDSLVKPLITDLRRELVEGIAN